MNVKAVGVIKNLRKFSHALGTCKNESLNVNSSAKEFISRRDKLCDSVWSLQNGPHLVFIGAQTQQFKMKDVPFKFNQATNFQYLTGYSNPNAILAMFIKDYSKYQTYLFVERLSAEQEIWEGTNPDYNAIQKITGIEEVYDINTFSKQIPLLYPPLNKLPCCIDNFTTSLQNKKSGIGNYLVTSSTSNKTYNIERLIQNLRVLKSPKEQEIMKHCCKIGCTAMDNTIQFSYPNVNESVLETKFELECKLHGSSGLAYIPVVAGGDRACTIHYTKNDHVIKPEEDTFILMDAGCQYQNYCSDITRTWPISNTYNRAQIELYEALLDVQVQCIKACVPNAISLNQLLLFMYQKLLINLSEIGLFPSTLSSTEKFQLVQKLCPHHVGHHLGLDIHDCDLVSLDELLLPNMIITIEPGVYIHQHDRDFPSELRGTGFRIEDDILITESGKPLNLTESCPKDFYRRPAT